MKMPIEKTTEQHALTYFENEFEAFCLQLMNNFSPDQPSHLGPLLFLASFLDDYSTVNSLLEFDLNALTDYGPLAAMVTAGLGYLDLTKCLFNKHPQWFTSDLFISSRLLYPLELAAIRGQQAIVDFLLPHTPSDVLNRGSLDSSIGIIDPLLVNLVKNKNPALLKKILAHKPNLEIRNPSQHTALSFACLYGYYNNARLLIEAGANVNVSITRPKTVEAKKVALPPIPHFEAMARSLLDSLTAEMTSTPLHYAAATGDPRLVYQLLKAGADPNVTGSFFGTPLLMAARAEPIDTDTSLPTTDYPNVVRLLLMYKADPNATHPFNGETALHAACDQCEVEPLSKQKIEETADVVKQLLLAGANPNIKNKFGIDANPLLKRLNLPAVFLSHQEPIGKRFHLQNILEKRIRFEIDKLLSTEQYQLPKREQRLPPSAQTLALESSASTTKKNKKKKKKKSNLQKKTLIKNHEHTVSQAAQPSTATTNQSPATTPSLPAVLNSPMAIAASPQENPTFTHADATAVLDQKTVPCVQVVASIEQSTASDTNAMSPIAEKPTTAPHQDPLSKIPANLFKSDIPTGGDRQKFPLSLAGVTFIHYFLMLIPDNLNAQFSSDRRNELHKIWATIKMERLLPASSKNKAGVKCLSVQEMQQLKVGFFKEATHKIKPNREDARVYLSSKVVKTESSPEIHLELIAPDFKTH